MSSADPVPASERWVETQDRCYESSNPSAKIASRKNVAVTVQSNLTGIVTHDEPSYETPHPVTASISYGGIGVTVNRATSPSKTDCGSAGSMLPSGGSLTTGVTMCVAGSPHLLR